MMRMGDLIEITEYGLEMFEKQKQFIERRLTELIEDEIKEKIDKIITFDINLKEKSFFVEYYDKYYFQRSFYILFDDFFQK